MSTVTHSGDTGLSPSYFTKASLRIQVPNVWMLSMDQREEEEYGSLHKGHGSKNLHSQGLGYSYVVKRFPNMPRTLGLISSNTHTGWGACEPRVSLVPEEARKSIRWNWNSRRLGVTVQVMGMEPESSTRGAGIVTSEPSLAPVKTVSL